MRKTRRRANATTGSTNNQTGAGPVADFCRLSRETGDSSHPDGGRGFVSLKFNHRNATPPQPHRINDQEIIMNIAKNMEAIFVAALVVAGLTGYATAAVPKFHTALHPAAIVASADASAMPTVVITAKRLSAEQKAAL
jgi:hypothetical protein